VLGASFRVTRDRGRLFDSDLGPPVIATIHPSAVLRADDRDAEMAGLISDLRIVSARLDELRGPS
jgi:DNA polymerase